MAAVGPVPDIGKDRILIMTLDNFAEVTRRIIATQGFADFQPTACFPSRREVRVLSELPPGQDAEVFSIDWARGLAEPDESFLIAVKVSAATFKVIRVVGAMTESRIFQAE